MGWGQTEHVFSFEQELIDGALHFTGCFVTRQPVTYSFIGDGPRIYDLKVPLNNGGLESGRPI